MKRPSISTRTGDTGTTTLYGGQKVAKSALRIHAYGDVDELNAILGVILAEELLPSLVRISIEEVQRVLFAVGADLATPLASKQQVQRLSNQPTIDLEVAGHNLEEELEPLQHFVLPSGSRTGALLHQARTVCRRAERMTVALSEQEDINDEVIVYLNRLSDYLFLAARYVNKVAGIQDSQWIAEDVDI